MNLQTDITGTYLDQILAKNKKSPEKIRTKTIVIDPETGAEIEKSEFVSIDSSDADDIKPEVCEKSVQVSIQIQSVPILRFNGENNKSKAFQDINLGGMSTLRRNSSDQLETLVKHDTEKKMTIQVRKSIEAMEERKFKKSIGNYLNVKILKQ